ncbi:MAG TPA: DUF6531 domain-containing protein, partial [Myxococcales bacterium]|nr:DUF6531 domain-containing protein [Myxococcales bacterium]
MLGSKFMDVVIGVDLHLESVPTPVGPIPLPFPQPFMGMIFDPAQLASTLMHGCPGLGLVFAALDPIGTLVNMAFDKLEPGTGGGPVVINGMPATNTQSQVTTRYGVPHIVIPPGAIFLMSGKAVMEGDAMFPFGSSSVWINGRRAVRTLMDPVFSCSDPVRLPTSMTMPAPIGPPVLVGGAPTPDLQAIISSKLRHLVTSGIKNLIGPPLARAIRGRNTPTSRWRNIIGKIACFWTGHPVDVATGRMVTTMTDWELPGPLPLVFERQYSSAVSDRDGALGFGWNHTLDQSVWLERGKVVYRTGDGREIVADTFDFPGRVMRPGDQVFEPCDRLTFRRRQDGWEIVTAEGVTHEFRRVEGDRTPGRWRLTKMRSRDGHEIKLEYDKFGTLAWVQDCGGRVIRFTHDRNGRLTQIDLPHPTQEGWLPYVKYSYSKDGNLVAVEDPLGHTTRYEYSGHLMVRETDRTGLSFYFGYDGIDSGAWCVRTWGDGGIYDHQIDYDKAGLRTYVTNSLGHTTVYRINETLAVVEVIDAHGGKTQYEYDEALRRTAEIDPLGNATRYEYDAGGNRTKKIQPDGTVLSVEYDADNLPLRAVDAIGGEWIWVRETSGRLVELINPLGERQRYKYMNGLLSEWISAAGHRTAYTYDHHKNLIWIERPNGAKIRFDYDALGRRVYERDERAGERRISFNAAGHVLRVERPEGEIERRRFDAAGNLVEVKSGLRHVRLGYTGFHKPAWREEGGSRVTLRYDAEDRLTGVINEAGET